MAILVPNSAEPQHDNLILSLRMDEGYLINSGEAEESYLPQTPLAFHECLRKAATPLFFESLETFPVWSVAESLRNTFGGQLLLVVLTYVMLPTNGKSAES